MNRKVRLILRVMTGSLLGTAAAVANSVAAAAIFVLFTAATSGEMAVALAVLTAILIFNVLLWRVFHSRIITATGIGILGASCVSLVVTPDSPFSGVQLFGAVIGFFWGGVSEEQRRMAEHGFSEQ